MLLGLGSAIEPGVDHVQAINESLTSFFRGIYALRFKFALLRLRDFSALGALYKKLAVGRSAGEVGDRGVASAQTLTRRALLLQSRLRVYVAIFLPSLHHET